MHDTERWLVEFREVRREDATRRYGATVGRQFERHDTMRPYAVLDRNQFVAVTVQPVDAIGAR